MLYSEVNFHTSFIVCIHLLHLDSKRNKSKLNLNCFLTVSCKAIEISNHLFNLTVTRYKCIIVLNLYCCEKLKISCIQPCENLDIILAIFFVCLRCCAGGQKVKVPRIQSQTSCAQTSGAQTARMPRPIFAARIKKDILFSSGSNSCFQISAFTYMTQSPSVRPQLLNKSTYAV